MAKSRVLFSLVALPAILAAQQQAPISRAAELISLARDQIRANRADSALSLLKLAADSTTGGAVSDREQAYILLGVIEYIAHRDSSATALAFRHALQLDPGLQAAGLAQVDSALERILIAERSVMVPDSTVRHESPSTAPPRTSSPPATPPQASSPYGPPHDCIRRCRGGEEKPEIVQRPQFTMLDPAVLGPSETRGLIVVHFVVGVEGAPEPESIRVTTNTAQGLTNQVLDALRATHFRPATLNGTPVRAEVEMRFEFRAAGYNTIDYTISGP